jgi:hypothetical protein
MIGNHHDLSFESECVHAMNVLLESQRSKIEQEEKIIVDRGYADRSNCNFIKKAEKT